MSSVKIRNLAVLFLIVLLAGVVLWQQLKPEGTAVWGQQATPVSAGPGAGKPAPAFTLAGNDNNNYTVDGPRDKAVILNFWASWCDPCRQEAPELNRMADKYKDVLDVYGINVTSEDYKPNAERFIKKYKLTFPVMFDLKGEVFAKYNGAVFPTNVFIDKNGVITEIVLGVLSPEDLEKKIISLTGS
ncbi:TlpA family protein disulfide reductase [Paenibacillus albidus]|uniref:TlpA family protein disulfide reductase n=1 Tax=Paenibacillus albidus TaxID=2041023 RepID=UPI001BE9292B|nr:TlpA disulfide reductase family protein [Paenibacillus albidus]MBT2293003.1 TlpA family protein disulfide reductase [Paenibacillus albidus]